MSYDVTPNEQKCFDGIAFTWLDNTLEPPCCSAQCVIDASAQGWHIDESCRGCSANHTYNARTGVCCPNKGPNKDIPCTDAEALEQKRWMRNTQECTDFIISRGGNYSQIIDFYKGDYLTQAEIDKRATEFACVQITPHACPPGWTTNPDYHEINNPYAIRCINPEDPSDTQGDCPPGYMINPGAGSYCVPSAKLPDSLCFPPRYMSCLVDPPSDSLIRECLSGETPFCRFSINGPPEPPLECPPDKQQSCFPNSAPSDPGRPCRPLEIPKCIPKTVTPPPPGDEPPPPGDEPPPPGDEPPPPGDEPPQCKPGEKPSCMPAECTKPDDEPEEECPEPEEPEDACICEDENHVARCIPKDATICPAGHKCVPSDETDDTTKPPPEDETDKPPPADDTFKIMRCRKSCEAPYDYELAYDPPQFEDECCVYKELDNGDGSFTKVFTQTACPKRQKCEPDAATGKTC